VRSAVALGQEQRDSQLRVAPELVEHPGRIPIAEVSGRKRPRSCILAELSA
jgi:hypothetical protein